MIDPRCKTFFHIRYNNCTKRVYSKKKMKFPLKKNEKREQLVVYNHLFYYVLCIEVGKRVGGSTSFSKQEVNKIEKHETIRHARKIIL
jgi:hypothetical protein